MGLLKMASSLCRAGYSVLRRSISRAFFNSSIRASSLDSNKKDVPAANKEAPKENWEYSENDERFEFLKRIVGKEDPFEMSVHVNVEKGTFEKPNLIPTTEDHRMIGCLCDEDDIDVKYTQLHLGEPKRCDCGTWFKLIKIDMEDDS